MSYKIEERQEAVENVLDAFNWYESREDGLGYRFLSELDDFYDKLERHPEAYSYVNETLREGKLVHFRYLVIFEIQGDKVIVFKVFHAKQDPSKKTSGIKF